MRELLRNWLAGIVCASMILALADGIIPKGGAKQICRLAGGLILLLATLSPLLKLGKQDLFEVTRRKESDMEAYIQAFEQENDFLAQSIIEEKTSAYISDKARELTGSSCVVTVITAGEEHSWPIPAEVILRGVWTQKTKEEMSNFLSAQMGIPESRQHYEEMES